MDKTLDNVTARAWYKARLNEIPDLVDKSLPLEKQARQAFDLRNEFRIQTRDMMADSEARKSLDESHPIVSFEDFIDEKMQAKGFTREQAYRYVIGSASRSNKMIDKQLGF